MHIRFTTSATSGTQWPLVLLLLQQMKEEHLEGAGKATGFHHLPAVAPFWGHDGHGSSGSHGRFVDDQSHPKKQDMVTFQ